MKRQQILILTPIKCTIHNHTVQSTRGINKTLVIRSKRLNASIWVDAVLQKIKDHDAEFIILEYTKEYQQELSKRKIPYVLLFPNKSDVSRLNDSVPEKPEPFDFDAIYEYEISLDYSLVHKPITEEDEKVFEDESFACKMRLGEAYLRDSSNYITDKVLASIKSIFLYALSESKEYDEYE